jgi:hypothetical protein
MTAGISTFSVGRQWSLCRLRQRIEAGNADRRCRSQHGEVQSAKHEAASLNLCQMQRVTSAEFQLLSRRQLGGSQKIRPLDGDNGKILFHVPLEKRLCAFSKVCGNLARTQLERDRRMKFRDTLIAGDKILRILL